MFTPIETYWCGGRNSEMAALLRDLVPFHGECDASTPKLEKFRKASNAYYNLYNNGVKTDFNRIFGVSGKTVVDQFQWNQKFKANKGWGDRFDSSDFAEFIKSECKMDKIVMDAAEEAGFLR